MQVVIIFFILTSVLFGCNSDSKNNPQGTWQEISGRDEQNSTIYQVRVSESWKRIDPTNREALQDTTRPICEFHITDGQETIRIAIHNFPSKQASDRIPPASQVARWKRQFEKLDLTTVAINPQAYTGYSGLLFEGSGQLAGQPTTVMAWSMQLAPELYRHLAIDESSLSFQKRADFTIKAQGSKTLLVKYREEIIAFARSFELKDPIPLKS